MSDDSDSDTSNLDVSEGTAAGRVQCSQIDSSVAQSLANADEVLSPTRSANKQSNEGRKKKQFLRSSLHSSQRGSCKATYTLSQFHTFDPNCYDSFITSSIHDELPLFYATQDNRRGVRKRFLRTGSSDGRSLQERFNQFQREAEARLSLQREEAEQDRFKECTFRPAVSSAHASRTASEVYHDMQRREKRREEHLRILRQEKEQQPVFSFAPTLCDKSVRMMQRKGHMGFQHLLGGKDLGPSNHYSLDASKEPQLLHCPFVPQVSPRSQNLVRRKSITQLLYDDAVKRMQRTAAVARPAHTRPSKHSVTLLIQRFLRDFEECRKGIDFDRNGKLNYVQFRAFLKAMRLVHSGEKRWETELLVEMWTKLGGSLGSSIAIVNLKVFLMGVMGFFQQWMNDSSVQSFTMTRKQVQETHMKYFELYKNRGSRQLEPPAIPTTVKSTNAAKIVERLLERGKEREERLKRLQDQREAKELQECTFTPRITPQSRDILRFFIAHRFATSADNSPLSCGETAGKSLFSAFSRAAMAKSAPDRPPQFEDVSSVLSSDQLQSIVDQSSSSGQAEAAVAGT